MDDPWPCQLCDRVLDDVRQLAQHLIDWHDEWVSGGQIPPITRLVTT